MDEQIVQEIVDEILSSLEPLDTQSAAVLQILKAKGIANDEELASHLEEAGKASNVRWLAARLRIRSLIASAMRTQEAQPAAQTEKESTKSSDNSNEPRAEDNQVTAQAKETDETAQGAEKREDNPDPDKPVPAASEQHENTEESKPIRPDQDAKRDAA